MLLRIRREIFRAGEFETHELDATNLFKEDICKKYNLDSANTLFYDNNGHLIKEDVLHGYSLVTAVQKPAELGTLAVVGFFTLWSLLIGVGIYTTIKQRNMNNAKITYSNSLRGARNPMRAGGPVGVLLGNYRVPLDMAGMVYSSISNNKQYIHQLFCAGYRPISDAHHPFYNGNCGVVLRKDTSQVSSGEYIYGGDGNPNFYKAWIGDTPFGSVANYISISASEDSHGPNIHLFPYYNKRCIEDNLSVKMLNGDTLNGGSADNILQYTAPSGCIRIGVCVSAPYGYYKIDKDGNQAETRMRYRVQYRKVGTSDWSNFDDGDIDRNINVNEYRFLHSKTLAYQTDPSYPYVPSDFSFNDRYEVRVINSIDHTGSSEYDTTLIVEFVQYDTVNTAKYPQNDAAIPVYNSQQYELVDMKAQATDKLNGYIDQFYVECYLQCRAYHGDGTETSNYWSQWHIPSTSLSLDTRIEMMSNPASVLLYVLTNKNVNPRALTWTEAQDKIDWIAFRDWYIFCNQKGWTCNAWITEELTIGKLCDLICRTGRALFRTVNGKYSVMLACAVPYITQMFTPRNAWDMQLSKNFEKPLDAVRVEFVDESTWTEAERTAYINDNNTVVIDEDITDIEDQLQVESFAIWGVTRPQQIGDLEAYELLRRRLQIRSYSWKCSLEGLLCAVGDVVYVANDNFLYSLGYGRIKSLEISGNNVVGVYVDESLGMELGHSYGITVRQNDGTFEKYDISSIYTDEDTFTKGILCTLATPIAVSSAKVEEGNLFMYGDSDVEGKKLLIVNIQYDGDRNATIEAVDYIPEIFTSLDGPSWVVPDFVSGISKYGSGANFARGVLPPSVNNPPTNVYPTDLDIDGQIHGLKYYVEYGLSTSPYEYIYFGERIGDDVNVPYGAIDSENGAFDYGLEDAAGWSSYYDGWYKGLYVWMRVKTVNADGIVTYNTPTYCKEITEGLIAGCQFAVVLTDSDGDGGTHTWEKNSADSTHSVSIQFRVMARAYNTTTAFTTALTSVEIVPYKNGVEITPHITVPQPSVTVNTDTGYGTAVYTFSLVRNYDCDSLVINATLSDTYMKEDGESTYTIVTKASETMTSVDVTVANPFGDLIPATKNAVNTVAAADALAVTYFTNLYGGVAEGATYAINCDNITNVKWLALRTHIGNNVWKWLSANDLGFSNARVSEICAKAQQCVLSKIPEGTVTLSDFGYFNTIIAGTITADYIGSKAISIRSGGYIKGGNRYGLDANDNVVVIDWSANGFWFDASGELRASLQSDESGNTYVGTGVSKYNRTAIGHYNTAMGYYAMYKTSTNGDYNCAFGFMAMQSNETGDYNVAVGAESLKTNVSGQRNVAVGYKAMFSNTTGWDNIAIGYQALYNGGTGNDNIAMGVNSLYSNVIGQNNVAIGALALENNLASFNVAVGISALEYNTIGDFNVAIGQQALMDNTTGNSNIAFGYDCNGYSATGCYQMNFNDAVIHLEFNASRTGGQIYNVLNSYFSSNGTVGAIGVFDGNGVAGISKTRTGISIMGLTGYSLATLSSGTSTTYTGRTVLTFANPHLTDSDRASEDCLTT